MNFHEWFTARTKNVEIDFSLYRQNIDDVFRKIVQSSMNA